MSSMPMYDAMRVLLVYKLFLLALGLHIEAFVGVSPRGRPCYGPRLFVTSQTTKYPVRQADDPDEYLYQVNLKLGEIANEAAGRRPGKFRLGKQALELFNSCDEPESVTYNSLLKVLAKVTPETIDKKPAAYYCDEKLEEMKLLYTEQSARNSAWYDKESKTDKELEDGPPIIKVKPNARTYATVMDAHARMGTVQSAKRVENLVHELEIRFRLSNFDLALEPNVIIYNTVLMAWANANNSTKCLEWLNDFPIEPDLISYNTVLNSLSKAKQPEAAEELLYSMQVEPGGRSFSTVMDAWARCGRPDKAHALLSEMLARKLEPNTYTFSIIINAYAKSKEPEKAIIAYKLFEQMHEYNVQPNKYTYNTLLNTIATDPRHPEQNLEFLKKIYCEMPEKDSVTYGTVLKGCGNLISYTEFPISVLEEAIENGHVSNGVLFQFRQAVPLNVFQDRVGDWRNIPETWSRNVGVEGRRRHS